MRMRHPIFRMACAAVASLQTLGSPAQSATETVEVQIRADRRAIRLGDPAGLTVTVTLPETSAMDGSVRWPDTVPHVEWLSPLKVDTALLAGGRRITFTRAFTSFDSGRWVIPSPAFMIDGRRFSGDTVGIEVGTVPLAGDDYRDIGDILEAGEESAASGRLPYAVLAAVLISAASWWLYRVWRRRRVDPRSIARSQEDAFSKAMSALDALSDQAPAGDAGVRELHTSLYGILRSYLFEAHGWRVYSLTTGDLLALLASRCADRGQVSQVAAVLRLSDAVRFARHVPSGEESLRSVGDLRSFIRFIHETVRHA